jgi:hypothetical protein
MPDDFSFNAPPHPNPLPQLRWRRGGKRSPPPAQNSDGIGRTAIGKSATAPTLFPLPSDGRGSG